MKLLGVIFYFLVVCDLYSDRLRYLDLKVLLFFFGVFFLVDNIKVVWFNNFSILFILFINVNYII